MLVQTWRWTRPWRRCYTSSSARQTTVVFCFLIVSPVCLVVLIVSICADPAVDEAMETASLLHEQFLPEAVAPLAEQSGDICSFEDMLPSVESLAEALGCALE